MIPREEVKIIRLQLQKSDDIQRRSQFSSEVGRGTRLNSALIKVGKATRGMCSFMHCWS